MERINSIAAHFTSSTPPLVTSVEGPNSEIGVITLNSGKSYNSLSSLMRELLASSIKQFQVDTSIKVICLRSTHPKLFCAGMDIKGMDGNTYAQWIDNDMVEDIDLAFTECRKPIVTAINGLALGGGFEIALLSDIIIAEEGAKFGLPEIKLGLMPGIGGTLIAKTIGKHEAMNLILTGDPISAERAYQLGIIQKISKIGELHKDQLDIALKLANHSRTSLELLKTAIKFSFDNSYDAAKRHERALFRSTWGLNASKIGVDAFIAKKKPDFSDC